MRIGLTIEFFKPLRGGAEQWTFQFAEQLLARGHEVHVIAQEFAPALHLPVVRHELGRIRSRIRLAEAVEATVRRLSLDVVHDMGVGWHCDVFTSHDGSRRAQRVQKLQLLAPWARPIKRAMMHWLPRYREFERLVERQLDRSEHLILALSRMVARDYQNFHGVSPQRIRLVYNGVDPDRFSPAQRAAHREPLRGALGIREEETAFLFVGHDFLRKGLATAIRAVGRLVRRGLPARLVVVGGRRLGAARRLAAACGAGKAVVLVGSVPDTYRYYAAADAYVLPTFYDPCSLGVLEAAASGLASVTTPFNGAGELLTEGVDGFLLDDPADDAELAVLLQRFLEPAQCRRMGDAARQLALRHTLRQNCDQIEAVYREVAAVRRAA